MSLMVGVDEVGRGPLAGPIVTCAVLWPDDHGIAGLDDSKKLSAKKREGLIPLIRDKALKISFGRADVEEIDTLNILRATMLAMERAVKGMLRRALSAAFVAWSSFAFADPRDLKIARLQETIALLHSRSWRRDCYIHVFKTWLCFIEERWEQRDAVKQNIDNLALELAIQTETERYGPDRRVSSLRY